MKKTLIIFVLVCLMVVLITGCSKTSQDSEPVSQDNGEVNLKDNYIFGSGSMGSFYYTSMEAMCTVLNNNIKEFKTSSISTNGGPENVVLLFNDKIDFGAMSGNDFVKSYQGIKPFQKKYEPVQVLTFGLAQQLIAVREGSGINSIQDLEGKKVAIGPNGSTLASTMKTYFDLAGVKIEPVYLSHEEGKDAFIGGIVDAQALLFMNNNPYPVTMQAEAGVKLKYLEWDKKVNRELIDKNLGFVLTTLPKGKSKYVTKDYEVFSSPIILGTRANVPEEVVYKIVKTLAENNKALTDINARLTLVKPETIDSGFLENYYVHKGTVKYLKEIGEWKEKYKVAE